MDAISYRAVRANLAKPLNQVCDDHIALIITRTGEAAVVMLSLADCQALEETAYLLRSPQQRTSLAGRLGRIGLERRGGARAC